jgi:hypothetical protein
MAAVLPQSGNVQAHSALAEQQAIKAQEIERIGKKLGQRKNFTVRLMRGVEECKH